MKRFSLIPKFLYTAVLCAALSAGGCSAVKELGSIVEAGDTFMKTMKDGDHDASFRMLSTELQKGVGGQEAWNQFAAVRVPTEWSFSSKTISSGQGKLEGKATFTTGQQMNVLLTLIKEGGAWKIYGFDFKT
jgi:hypothetical protein